MNVTPAAHPELNRFIAVLAKENDRGAALTAAAFMDNALLHILTGFLADVPATKQLLTGFSAPLATFSARSRLVLSLGLVDGETFGAIETTRRIRNRFAHGWDDLSFEDDGLRSLVETLPQTELEANLPDPKRVRRTFDRRVIGVLLELAHIPLVLLPMRRTPTRLIRYTIHSTREAADAEAAMIARNGNPPSKT